MRRFAIAALCGFEFVASVSGAFAAVGAPNPGELTFTPLPGCRAIDTRTQNAKIAANATRQFVVAGDAPFPSQGGAAKGCGVPTYATAVSLALTTLNETAAGSVTVYAPGTARPATTTLSYVANIQTTASVIAPVANLRIAVTLTGGAANLTGDVNGFYAPPIHAQINKDGTIASGTSRVLSSVRNATGEFTVTVDRDLTGCSATATAIFSGLSASAQPAGNTVFVGTFDSNGAHDAYFQLNVSC